MEQSKVPGHAWLALEPADFVVLRDASYGPPFNAALTPLIEEDASVLTFLDPLATHP